MRQYRYDYVANSGVTQDQFIKNLSLDTNLDKLFEGYNSTIFAYGPTSSGKTYTMQGMLAYDSDVR